MGPGCAKTRVSQRYTKLFSQSPSPNRGCQYNRFSHLKNGDRFPTHKLSDRVFTQPGSKATEMVCPRHVCLAPDSDRTADIAEWLTDYPSAGNSRRSRPYCLAASHRLANLEPLELRMIQVQRLILPCPTVRCPKRLRLWSRLQTKHGFPTPCEKHKGCDRQPQDP
jgi:hypothetical protein